MAIRALAALTRLRRFVTAHQLAVVVVVAGALVTFVLWSQYEQNLNTQAEAKHRTAAVHAAERKADVNLCRRVNKVIDELHSLVDGRAPSRLTAKRTLSDRTATPTQKQRATLSLHDLDAAAKLLTEHVPIVKCATS